MIIASAWIDLTDGPMVLRLPPTQGAGFDLTLIDTAGEPFASLGSRTTATTAGVDVAVVGPRWSGDIPQAHLTHRAVQRRLLGGQPHPRPFAARPSRR